ncbi:MAG TPA: hypothetical protein VHO84_02875 [Syntrophorhabdaceae bacterium]|nr:hypothetical protein [Syntrophorhabdaceae bacterium]
MEKKLVLFRNGKPYGDQVLPDIFKEHGWVLQTMDTVNERSLQGMLHSDQNLLIMSKTANMFERSTWPIIMSTDF